MHFASHKKNFLEQLTSQYDGFCFERTAKSKVFAPWSLLKFFSEPESGFLDYWFESGGKPSVLLGYLKSHTLRNPEEYGREKNRFVGLFGRILGRRRLVRSWSSDTGRISNN